MNPALRLMAAKTSVGGWSPLDLETLAGWWDASDSGSFTYSSGTLASQWDDLSGLNRHLKQPTVGNQPSRNVTVNGLAAVKSDATDDTMTTDDFTLSQPFTVICVAKRGATIPTYSVLWQEDSGGNRPILFASRAEGSGVPNFYAGSGLITWGPQLVADELFLFSNAYNGASSAGWKNGSSVTLSGSPGTAGFAGGFRIGSNVEWFGGAWCEIILCAGVLPTEDRESAEKYLAAKWGGWKFLGGIITESGGYRVHTFKSSSSLIPVSDVPVEVEYLVVAGGGGGGANRSGGGGAGGFKTGTLTISATQTITVGTGGTPGIGDGNGTAGGNSSIGSLVESTGGGFGSSAGYGAGGTGGSGGGGSANGGGAGSGTSGQGSNGAAGTALNNDGAGGGGGGASATGATPSGAVGGTGGAGTASSISGSSVTYAGGGGGGADVGSAHAAGVGGAGGGGTGGNVGAGTAGTANTGGGGGGGGGSFGAYGGAGAAGGSGVVIIRYPI